MPMTAQAVPRRATFVIYIDEPASSSSASKMKSRPLRPRTNITVTIATAGDKENLHPLTGRRPSADDVKGKKRKTTALATKLLVVTDKPASETKKRKLANAASVSREEKKEKAKKTRRASRLPKLVELPKVTEEVEENAEEYKKNERTVEEVFQAAADARCYELTVRPLADVTEAYEQITPSGSVVTEDSKVGRDAHHPVLMLNLIPGSQGRSCAKWDLNTSLSCTQK